MNRAPAIVLPRFDGCSTLTGLVALALTLAITLASALAIAVAPRDALAQTSRPKPVVVASKPFGESYLLAELFAQVLEARGIAVVRRPGLGATDIAFAALRTDAIDVYPEYTGTGLLAILHDTLGAVMRGNPRATFGHVSQAFAARYGIRWLPPLGFQNGYAIAVRRETAERFHLRSIGDLSRVADSLTAGLTSDFIGRPDGLPGLTAVYGVRFRAVRPLAPAVKYAAIASGAVDVVDGYSTDGLLVKYDLVTLDDDRHFFPPYEAAALLGPRVTRDRADVVSALTALSGRIDEAMMRAANRRVEVDRVAVVRVAADLLAQLALNPLVSAPQPADAPRASDAGDSEAGFWRFFWARRDETVSLALQHLLLVALGLGAAIAAAVPLGLALERHRRIAEGVIGALGVVQTIPSIALLAFMIPVLGVGVRPALVALWLYALYPIVRNTYSGVRDADRDAVEASEAMGATAGQRLLWVRLPLAAPVVLAGVRTAAVITVGAATLAAFIGAGGLGEPIVTGLALADSRLVLAGALPAALLALAVDGLLALVERAVTPAHLRRGTSPSPSI